jgi:hypothetical protein
MEISMISMADNDCYGNHLLWKSNLVAMENQWLWNANGCFESQWMLVKSLVTIESQ